MLVELLSGRRLEVSSEFVPGDGDGWNSPIEPASIEIEGVWEDGEPVDVTEAEEKEILACCWKERMIEVNEGEL